MSAPPFTALALPTSFGGSNFCIINKTCKLVVITSATLSTSLSHHVPNMVNRAGIWVDFLSFEAIPSG